MDIVSLTEQNYWNLVLNKERLKVLQNSLNLAKDLLKINKEKEKAGILARIEVLSTEATIASREESLLQGKRALGQSEDALKRILNPSGSVIDWNMSLNTSGIPGITKENLSFQDSYSKSLNNRPDFQATLIDDETLKLQADIAKQNSLPDLTFNGSFGLNSLDKNYLNAVGSLLSLKTYSWNVGLNLEIPVAGNVNETGYKQLLLSQERQKIMIENFKQAIINDIRTSIRDVEINEQRAEANKRSKELMNEQVKAETEKFKLGLSTNFQVMQFQKALEDTSLNEVNARIDYLKSLSNLSKAEGTILEKNKIIWDGNY